MKKLESLQLEKVSGGAGNFGDWFCGGVAAAGVVVGISGPIGWTAAAGCAIYGTGRLADWW